MAKSVSPRVSKAEKARRAARRAELRLEKKRAEEALQRKRSRAAKKGWKTREAKKTPKKSPEVTQGHDDTPSAKSILAELCPDEIQDCARRLGRTPATIQRWLREGLPKSALEDIRAAQKRVASAKKAAETRKKKSILASANVLQTVFREIPANLGGPKTLLKHTALAKASIASPTARNKLLAEPTFETLQALAEDFEEDREPDEISPFWYH